MSYYRWNKNNTNEFYAQENDGYYTGSQHTPYSMKNSQNDMYTNERKRRPRKSYYSGGYKQYKYGYGDYTNYKSAGKGTYHQGDYNGYYRHSKENSKIEDNSNNQVSETKVSNDTSDFKSKNQGSENPYANSLPNSKNKESRRTESFDYSSKGSYKRQDSNTSNISESSTHSKLNPQSLNFDSKIHQNSQLNTENFESESNMTDTNINDLSYFSTSVDGDMNMSAIESSQADESQWKSSKYHNPSIFCLKNCSTWRLKVRKTNNPYQHQKGRFENHEKETYNKTYILSKKVAIRGQEVNVDFMQDLQEADNYTSIESPLQLDTGYDKQKEKYSQCDGLDFTNTDNSSILLDALLPIQNENRVPEFCHLNPTTENKENIL